MPFLPLPAHIPPLHIATYLLALCLFSISFLVFLNASTPFVLSTLLHIPPPIGDIVGTLGFADELVVIVAAPLWGAISDGRVGTRGVAATGFVIVGVALVAFVNVKSVYPGLLLVRMLFAVGAAAVATMVSAVLPEMTAPAPIQTQAQEEEEEEEVRGRRMPTPPPGEVVMEIPETGVILKRSSSGRLAGLVGMFTGLGALLAVSVFLPLPARLAGPGEGGGELGVQRGFYVVASLAGIVAVWCWLGLPKPHRHEEDGVLTAVKRWLWVHVWGGDPALMEGPPSPSSCTNISFSASVSASSINKPSGGGLVSLTAAVRAARTDSRIALAYLGGFVARSTSVGISLFVPLLVNHHFVSRGKCPATGGGGGEDMKEGCREAYMLAAALTGISQLSALLCAPLVGVWVDCNGGWSNGPLVVGGLVGVLGFGGLAVLGEHGEIGLTAETVMCVVAMGIAQISGIVGSLGVLGKGVVDEEAREEEEVWGEDGYDEDARVIGEEEPLLRRGSGGSGYVVGTSSSSSSAAGGGGAGSGSCSGGVGVSPAKRDVKGGIAGVYSLCGGVGILTLTKVGGWGFDNVTVGWPFWLLAAFEGVLVVGAVLEGVCGRRWRW